MANRRSRRNSNGEGSVFQATDGNWRGFVTVGYTADGRQVKKWRRGKTKRAVVEKLNEISRLSGSRLVSAPERVTVGEWLTRFAELRGSELRPSSRAKHQHYLSKIVPALGSLQLARLTALQVRMFYEELVNAGLSQVP